MSRRLSPSVYSVDEDPSVPPAVQSRHAPVTFTGDDILSRPTRTFDATPKAELHVHLFGAIPAATLLELSSRHGVELPEETTTGLREGFAFRDFDHFSEILSTLRPVVRSAEDLELITYEFGRELVSQRVQYAEVMVTPMGLELRGIRFPESLDAMNRARSRLCVESGLELRWIFDLNRSVPDLAERSYWADYAVEVAVAGRDAGVVALGLSGAERGNDPQQFAPWFDRARAAGLHSVPHAGEHDGPSSVWGALRVLGAERIAHGVRAIGDPALVTHLAERRIPLDVCPSSNVRLGVYGSLASHPLPWLHRAGVPLTVNSDNPTMFGVTLNDEVDGLSTELGLDGAAVSEIIDNGFRFGFEAEAACALA